MAIFEFKRLLEQQESAVEIIACQSLAGLDARQDGRMAGHSMSITSCTPVHSSARIKQTPSCYCPATVHDDTVQQQLNTLYNMYTLVVTIMHVG